MVNLNFMETKMNKAAYSIREVAEMGIGSPSHIRRMVWKVKYPPSNWGLDMWFQLLDQTKLPKVLCWERMMQMFQRTSQLQRQLRANSPDQPNYFQDTALTVGSTQNFQFVHAISLDEEMIGEC